MKAKPAYRDEQSRYCHLRRQADGIEPTLWEIEVVSPFQIFKNMTIDERLKTYPFKIRLGEKGADGSALYLGFDEVTEGTSSDYRD